MSKVIYNLKAFKDDFTEDFLSTPDFVTKDTNSEGFRSDEFTNIHNEKHIIFSGCSNTFGVGLEKNEGWAWKTYQKIIKQEKCSGFFNLGASGTGIAHIIINIFKYCKKYGNPEVIFINLSNQNRSFSYSNEIKGYCLSFGNGDRREDIKLYNYQYYFMLEQYCKSNNIKLFSFTWDTIGTGNFFLKSFLQSTFYANKIAEESTNSLFKKYNFDTFYSYDFERMIDDLKSLQNDSNDKYFITARDNMHYGIGYNTIWSNFIYDKYVKDSYV